jgi:hypothetical protein
MTNIRRYIPPRYHSVRWTRKTLQAPALRPLYRALLGSVGGTSPPPTTTTGCPLPFTWFCFLLSALSPTSRWALPISDSVHVRASEDSTGGYPPIYSPLSFPSLGRVPVFSIVHSTKRLRRRFPVIPLFTNSARLGSRVVSRLACPYLLLVVYIYQHRSWV